MIDRRDQTSPARRCCPLVNRSEYRTNCTAATCCGFVVQQVVRQIRVCPTNSADRHSIQFTINKTVYKIFGAMSKDLNSEICVGLHFGIDSVENLVANRRNRFIKRHGEKDDYLCQMLRWPGSFVCCIFIALV